MACAAIATKVVGFCLAALALAACQAVAGIEEDRKLDPNAGKPVYSEECKDYCATVMDACTGENKAYTNEDNCLGVCALLAPGDSEDTHNNTLACRIYYANEAKLENSYCAAAGPGGNGTCGSDCEAYCQLFSAACKDDVRYSDKDCLKFCATLPDQPTLDVARDHDGDTIECRLVHLSSATLKPKEHCPHAPLAPSTPWCINLLAPKSLIPNCEDYCKITLAACTGPLAQYDSDEQCQAVCGELDPGTNDDQKGNTVGCRRYHAFNASLGPENHCSHAGPTGDGHCGDPTPISDEHRSSGNCESYCTLLAAACPTELADELGSAEDCMEACVDLPEAGPDAKYSLTNADESTGLNCRVLYTVRAFEDSTACASAIGGDQCAE